VPLARLAEEAAGEGFLSIFNDGVRHLAAGRTTVAEMTRVLSLEERMSRGED
jgi:type II secretory ATPase GspE/PulE/Tfp pilus assembly ATPase PilB-like protein